MPAMTTGDATTEPAAPMNPWRVRMVYAVVGVIVLGHLYEIVRQQEHWPFTNYPMWARVSRDWHVREVMPFGVTDEPAPREVDLREPGYFAPMPAIYQRLNFQRAAGREKLRDPMLGDYLRRYEQLRRAGRHGGPPLKGLRLYEWYWTMDPRASNVKSPDRKTLLYEFPAPATQPATRPAGGGL
jgi:hypothetical protein